MGKRKPLQMTVGKRYWQGEGSPKRYTLYRVTNKHGGVSIVSPSLTAREAAVFVRGYNSRVGRGKGRIGVP